MHDNPTKIFHDMQMHSEPQSWKTNTSALKLYSLGFVMFSKYVPSSLNKSSNSWCVLNKALLNNIQLWSHTWRDWIIVKGAHTTSHINGKARHWSWPHYQILGLTTVSFFIPWLYDMFQILTYLIHMLNYQVGFYNPICFSSFRQLS